MFANEILYAKPEGKTYYYEVVSVFRESHTADGSRLLIELIPLNQVVPGPRKIVSKYKKLDQRLTFDLRLDHQLKGARFATARDVLLPLDFRSCGLGAYVFSKLIEWGKAHSPRYMFQKLSLSAVDAETDVDKQRRNRFYKSFGFKLDFSQDPEERCGSCQSDFLSSLTTRPINNNKVFRILDLNEHFAEMADRNEKLEKDLQESLREIVRLQEQHSEANNGKKKLLRLSVALGAAVLLQLFLLIRS